MIISLRAIVLQFYFGEIPVFRYFLILVCILFCWPAHARTIVFAVDATYPPMEMQNAQAHIIGFDPDLIRAIAGHAGFTAEFVNVAWDDIFTGLTEGRYDAIASSVSILDARKAFMDFSDPYFEVEQAVVTGRNAPIHSIEDLNGKRVAAQGGTTNFELCKKLDRLHGAFSRPYQNLELAMIDLRQGRIDAVIADSPVAANFALQDEYYAPYLDLAFSIPSAHPEYLGFAVRKGDTELLELLNRGLEAARKQGDYTRIRNKWFASLSRQVEENSFWSFMKWSWLK